jgi:hypothetical protein
MSKRAKNRTNAGSWAWDDQPLRPMANIDKTEWWEMAANDAVVRELEGRGSPASAYQRAFERTVKDNEVNTTAVHDCATKHHAHRASQTTQALRHFVTPSFHGTSKSAAHMISAFLNTVVANETAGRTMSCK